MRKVRSTETGPEKTLRSLIWSLGYRGYRKNYTKLPGKPDIVFIRRKLAVFLHGCFWHGHNCKAGKNTPKSNQSYWIPKLRRNKERDREIMEKLKSNGWSILVIWECELKNQEKVKSRINDFLRE